MLFFSFKTISGNKGLDSATKFKKTILRYCLLSWTMMFTHVNLKMKDKYGMTEDAIIEKGLATTEEIKKLKGKATLNVGRSNFISFEKDLLSQSKLTWLDHWFVPLNWCCHMIKDELSKGGHIPR